jgi:hypothetical protein
MREKLQNGERTRQAARTIDQKKKDSKRTERNWQANLPLQKKSQQRAKVFILSYLGLLNNLNVIFFTIFRHPRSLHQGFISVF